jgi:hypothetical protein
MQDRNGADSAYLVPGPGYLASGTRSVFILHHAYPMGAFFEDKCQVPGTRYRVPGAWDLVPGTGVGPTPMTEDRARPPENAHTGYAG